MIAYASIAWLAYKLSVGLLQAVSASLYDIRAAKQRKQVKSTKYRPYFTVIISQATSAQSVAETLKSISSTRYRKYDIIIELNQTASKALKGELKTLISKYTKTAISLVVLTRSKSSMSSYQKKRYVKGDAVLVLKSGQQCMPDALRCAAQQFMPKNGHERVQPSYFINDYSSLLTSFQSLNTLRSNYSRTISARFDIYRNQYSPSPITSSSAYKSLTAGKSWYVPSIVIRSPQVISYKAALRGLFGDRQKGLEDLSDLSMLKRAAAYIHEVILLLEPAAIAYFFYVALRADVMTPYVIYWVLIASLYGMALWHSGTLNNSEKLRLIPLLTIMHLLYFIHAAVRALIMLAIFTITTCRSLQNFMLHKKQMPLLVTRKSKAAAR